MLLNDRVLVELQKPCIERNRHRGLIAVCVCVCVQERGQTSVGFAFTEFFQIVGPKPTH